MMMENEVTEDGKRTKDECHADFGTTENPL